MASFRITRRRLVKSRYRLVKILAKIVIYALPRPRGKGSALCAIALNEDKYIDEWITYHLCLGFDRIVIYDNSEANTLSFLNGRYGDRVEVKSLLGPCQQLAAYNKFINEFKGIFRWAAFIDCDEFIVLKKHRYINDFLNAYCKRGGLALNWLFFGSNGQKTYSPEPVLSRFIRCQKALNPHIKCIVNLRDVLEYEANPHTPTMLFGKIKDCNGRIVPGAYNPQGRSDIAIIHHYWTKSWEEWLAKVNRGMADVRDLRRTEEFHEVDETGNEIVDTTARDFYLKYHSQRGENSEQSSE